MDYHFTYWCPAFGQKGLHGNNVSADKSCEFDRRPQRDQDGHTAADGRQLLSGDPTDRIDPGVPCEMTKDGNVCWVGAAVPLGTSDFTKAQVFFHPTVLQDGRWVATDGDYPAFRGGWSGSLQRYVAMQGGQLAGARQTSLIVPFMTMSEKTGRQPAYMFGTRPVETLGAIMTAVRDAAKQPSAIPVQLTRIGASSFSSGIGAMRHFVGTFGGSGLIVETTDLDSPVIVGSQQIITRSPGAHGRVFSQVAPPRALNGWMTMRPAAFRNIHSYRNYHDEWQRVHAQIGWMMFYAESLGSVLP